MSAPPRVPTFPTRANCSTAGVAHCAKKLGEEAVEVALAAVTEDREHLIGEAADLLYHLFVVLEARGIKLAEVEAVLGERTAYSGLDEKAARKGG